MIRSTPEAAPNAGDRRLGDAQLGREHAGGGPAGPPRTGATGRTPLRSRHGGQDGGDLRVRHGPRATRARTVGQGREPAHGEPGPPAAHQLR